MKLRCFHRTALAVGSCLVGACAATAPAPPPPWVPPEPTAAVAPDERRQGPALWRALELLDDALAEGEWRLMQGLPVRSSRMTHLRLTRSAVDLLGRGEGDRAAGLLERAIAADGREGFAYLYLGKFYLESGMRGQGDLLLERAAVLLPDDDELERQVDALRFAPESSAAADGRSPSR